MTKLELKGSWNDVKGRLKQKYGNLTDDYPSFVESTEEELAGRLQQEPGAAGETRDEVESL